MPARSEPVGPTAAWSAKYVEYLATSAERATYTAELTRQLLRRIARGDLAPTVLESAHSAFLTVNMAESADRLADATMRFLTGLVEAGSRYSWELVEGVVPGEVPMPEDGASPRFERGDWSTWFQRLIDYAADRNGMLTAMLRSVLDKIASGEISPSNLETLSEQFHGERLPSAVDRIVELYFELLDRLDETHASYRTRYLESALALARPAEPVNASLALVGPLGGTATARFAVGNSADAPTSVRSVLSDVRRSDGVGPAFDPDATVAPDRFVLAARTDEVLTLSVAMSPDRFEVGPEYEGTLRVLGPVTTLVELPLRLRAQGRPEPSVDDQ